MKKIIIFLALILSICILVGCDGGAGKVNGGNSGETEGATFTQTAPETPESEIESQTEPSTEKENTPDTDPETDPATESEKPTETEQPIDPETDPETEPETDPDTEPETDPETDSEAVHSHSFGEWTVEAQPTCSQAGKEIRTCECGETEEKAIEALSHNFGEWKTVSDPTCSTPGKQERRCECGATEEKLTDMLDHTFGEWTAIGEFGCEDEQIYVRLCECGAEERKTVSPIGHNEVITDAVFPTDVSVGYTEKVVCKTCSKVIRESQTVGLLKKNEVDIIDEVRYVSNQDGYLTFTWILKEEYKDKLLGMNVSVTNDASVWEYKIFSYEPCWNYQAKGNLVRFTFTFTPITRDGIQGNPVQVMFYWFPDTYTAEFPRMEIYTLDGELPTFTKTSPPAGAWGGGITDANYVQSMVSLYNENNNLLYSSVSSGFDGAKIKVRGNTSAYGAKQPFKIKLAKKYDLLGGLIDRDPTKDYRNKDWVLLKGGTLTNVAVGSAISELVGNEWTPQYCYVTLFVNGEYRGLYILIECIDQDEMRCNVSDSGYIVEFDAYWWNEPLYFTTPITEKYPAKLTFKYPDSDELTLEDERVAYIQAYLSSLENVMLGKAEGDLNDYLDIRSCAKWTLTHDLLASWDSGGSNMYMLKYDNTLDSKMRMGPVWDYDSIYWSHERYKYDTFSRIREGSHFYIKYLTANPDFIRIYREEYDAVRHEVSEVVSAVFDKYDNDTYRMLLARDRSRWGTGYDNPAVQKQTVLEWFENHLSWMDVNVPFPTE